MGARGMAGERVGVCVGGVLGGGCVCNERWVVLCLRVCLCVGCGV